MNDAPLSRGWCSALAGLCALFAGACAPATWPDHDFVDPQDCAEDALHKTIDLELARQAAAQAAERCRSGDPVGCSMLGVVRELGQGVTRDRARALSLYRFACAARNLRACGNLGEMLLADLTRGDSPDGAADLLGASCKAGHARACGVLGRAYDDGVAVARAPALAVAWSERACAKGDGASCLRVVDLGAAPIRVTALLTAACMRGLDDGCARLDRRPGAATSQSRLEVERRDR